MPTDPLVIYLLIRLAVAVIGFIILLREYFKGRMRVEPFLLWSVTVIFLPWLAILAHLIIGRTSYPENAFESTGLSEEQLSELRDKEDSILDSEPEDMKWAVDYAKAIRNIGGTGYTRNNDVKLIVDGKTKFDYLLEDLRNAQTYIHLQYYIVRDDKLGNEFLSILTEKAQQGVEVKLMSDDLGKTKKINKAIKKFESAGGKYALFHRMLPLAFSPKKNERNHRKIIIIDGKIGYCGGFNVGDEYIEDETLGVCRDTVVRIVGDAAVSLEIGFQRDWAYITKETLENEEKYIGITNPPCGEDRAQVVRGGPNEKNNPIQLHYLKLIQTAQRTLFIHTPYLDLDDTLTDALIVAAKSGVDVRIIIPKVPDILLIGWLNEDSAFNLQKKGIRVYQYENGFFHSKGLVADGKYCSVGSSNMDMRSLIHNFETNTMIYSEKLGKEMEEAFLKDQEHSIEFDLNIVLERNFKKKFRDMWARNFRTLI